MAKWHVDDNYHLPSPGELTLAIVQNVVAAVAPTPSEVEIDLQLLVDQSPDLPSLGVPPLCLSQLEFVPEELESLEVIDFPLLVVVGGDDPLEVKAELLPSPLLLLPDERAAL